MFSARAPVDQSKCFQPGAITSDGAQQLFPTGNHATRNSGAYTRTHTRPWHAAPEVLSPRWEEPPRRHPVSPMHRTAELWVRGALTHSTSYAAVPESESGGRAFAEGESRGLSAADVAGNQRSTRPNITREEEQPQVTCDRSRRATDKSTCRRSKDGFSRPGEQLWDDRVRLTLCTEHITTV